MSNLRSLQSNFTAGELSPRLLARSDLSRYGNGAAGIVNFLVQPHGGATRRPGSYYVGQTKSQSENDTTIIRPFVVSSIAAYAIEFGNLYMRFFRNRGQVTSSGTPIELTTPWATSILRELRFAQSADVLYITHPSTQPYKLSRIATDQFQLEPVDFQNGPYLAENEGAPPYAYSSSSNSSAGDAATPPPASGSYTPGGVPDTGGSQLTYADGSLTGIYNDNGWYGG